MDAARIELAIRGSKSHRVCLLAYAPVVSAYRPAGSLSRVWPAGRCHLFPRSAYRPSKYGRYFLSFINAKRNRMPYGRSIPFEPPLKTKCILRSTKFALNYRIFCGQMFPVKFSEAVKGARKLRHSQRTICHVTPAWACGLVHLLKGVVTLRAGVLAARLFLSHSRCLERNRMKVIKAKCLQCAQSIEAPLTFAGTIVECPGCGIQLQLPAFDEPVPIVKRLTLRWLNWNTIRHTVLFVGLAALFGGITTSGMQKKAT